MNFGFEGPKLKEMQQMLRDNRGFTADLQD
jgi:hypothetical protein